MKKHYITRRILTMLLAVVLLFAALPNSVYAQSFQDNMQDPITAQSAPQSVQPAPARISLIWGNIHSRRPG